MESGVNIRPGTDDIYDGLYSKGHKRLKLSSDRNVCDGMVLPASIDIDTVERKPSSTSASVDYTDPLAIPNFLEGLNDGGIYESIEKDIKAFSAQIHQVPNPLLAKYPSISNGYFIEERRSELSPELAVQRALSLAQNNIIDLEDDCVDKNAPAAATATVIIDADKEQTEDQRPSYSFEEVFPNKDPGVYVGVEDEESTEDDDGLRNAWMEMSMAIASSKDVTVDPLSEESTSEGDCEHSFVLKDDLGYVCRICGVIGRSIDTIFEFRYNKVGEVVDGPDDGMKRPVPVGSEYDIVFDVDIGDGEPIWKLLYNQSGEVGSLFGHGSTIIVIQLTIGIIIAVDSRSRIRSLFPGTRIDVKRLESDDENKLFIVTNEVYLAGSGSATRIKGLHKHLVDLVSTGVTWIEMLRDEAHSYLKEHEVPEGSRGIEVFMLGWSAKKQELVVYKIGDNYRRTHVLRSLYDVVGSGQRWAFESLRAENLRIDMGEEAGCQAGRRALVKSASVDPGTGGILRVYLVTPTSYRRLWERHTMVAISESHESTFFLSELYVILPRDDDNDLSELLCSSLSRFDPHLQVQCLGCAGDHWFLYRLRFHTPGNARRLFLRCQQISQSLRQDLFRVHPQEWAIGYVAYASRELLARARTMVGYVSLL